MTPGERIAAAIAVSAALHWAVLGFGESTPTPIAAGDAPLLASLSGANGDLSFAAPLSLEQAQPTAADADSPADRRRAALTAYLDALAEAVHARRSVGGGGLIGNAAVALVVDAAGRFSEISLASSSGNAALDADALAAVRAASGAVARPRGLGTAPLRLVLEVKYQFDL